MTASAAIENEMDLENRIGLYGLLGSVFLTLPDEEFLESLVNMDWSESDSRGCNEIAEYAQAQKGRDAEEVLLELGRDRAVVIRGANNKGMEPPYEALYIKGAPKKGASNQAIGSLNRFYADAGFQLSDEAKDSSDQIGIEFMFVQLLLQRELDALREGNADAAEQWQEVRRHFMSQHLGRWAHDYACAMRNHASTGFYRGIALLIEETV